MSDLLIIFYELLLIWFVSSGEQKPNRKSKLKKRKRTMLYHNTDILERELHEK